MTFHRCYRSCEAMGTRFEIFLSGDDEEHLEAVAVAALDEVVRLDGVLSRFNPRSEIARINRDAGVKATLVDREVFALLKQCEQARQFTEEYFDITAISGCRSISETPALQLDAESYTVQFTRPEVVIDLGGVGKGYALDRVREILLHFGVTEGLLQGGTSSILALDPAEGNDWLVAIRHPLTPEAAPIVQLNLVNRGFSCSAARHPGQQQSDVINPQTGETLGGNAACVVLATSATEAEIFSTALLAMGRDGAMRYLQRNSFELQVGWFELETDFTWLYSV